MSEQVGKVADVSLVFKGVHSVAGCLNQAFKHFHRVTQRCSFSLSVFDKARISLKQIVDRAHLAK